MSSTQRYVPPTFETWQQVLSDLQSWEGIAGEYKGERDALRERLHEEVLKRGKVEQQLDEAVAMLWEIKEKARTTANAGPLYTLATSGRLAALLEKHSK